jgi:hapalindole-type alkaloid chlorinase
MVSPFTILEVNVADGLDGLLAHKGLVQGILDGQTAGAILRGFYSAAALEPVVAKLATGQCAMRARPSPYFTGRTYGRLLTAETDLGAYYREAERVDQASNELFAPIGSFRTKFEQALQLLSGQQPVAVPHGPEGQMYLPISIREMLPGGSIDLHYENETFDCPAMKHLNSQLDGMRQASSYLTLAAPESGGELRVYPVREHTAECKRFSAMDRTSTETFSLLEKEHGYHVLDAGPGDLLLFDAGRYFHRVTPVTGTRARWTMGGFVARSRDGTVYYWS